ncbi:hypothetical protein, partial [Suilimivivens sp.]|uniref:hypothetical protein n=1 Tax=Suilimivivens sp. TaxID=2981669 RepID=UPI003079A56B
FRIFRVALLFICQGTCKADSCVKVISESLLSGNCFHAGIHCATALSEQLRCELALQQVVLIACLLCIIGNQWRSPTEKEGFEPSRRY